VCFGYDFFVLDRHRSRHELHGKSFSERERLGAVSSHDAILPLDSWIETATKPASSSKVTVSDDLISPNSPMLASTNAVPTFGWPANGSSLAGVKIRTCRV